MISCAVGAFSLLAVRAWGVVIRELRWFRAGVVGGRICGVVAVEEMRCILAHLTVEGKNELCGRPSRSIVAVAPTNNGLFM